ncbi:MAG: 2-oxoacid:acceptor oxidoreductase family protein [Acidilobaceae archaeon]
MFGCLLRELLILSRGGQGGVTASRILASAATLEGRWAQAIPEFGAERRGAIVRSYLRLSDRRILRHSSVRRPEGVVVFSSRILELIDVDKVIPLDSTVLVNSPVRPRLGGRVVYSVDATGIALKLGLVIAGWPVVNTAMASAAARVFNIASLDSIVGALGEYFRGKLLEVNVEAAKIAWGEVA